MGNDMKTKIEADGFTVTQRYHVGGRRILTYVRSPNGLEYKWFGSLHDIDHTVVEDGENFYLDVYAWPTTYCPPGDGSSSANEIWQQNTGMAQYNENGTLIIDWMTVGLIVLAVMLVTSVLLFAIANILRVIADPCGQTSWVDINECWKTIRFPDCKYDNFNTCGGPDYNDDGKPDGQWANATDQDDPGTPNPQGGWPDWFDPGKIIMWIAIAAVAVGGTYVAVKIFTRPKQPKYNQPPNSSYTYSYQ